ncbi:MAG: EFR1 family ferrodoxin [Asgard group archaeon]|nr:EFR1 family ferrodoxin [Asgard group archaeon]
MNCAFVYFSGTGITPKFASEIAKGINKQIPSNFDFIRVKKGKTIDIAKYDLIGIGAPAYSLRAPRFMTKFMKKMNFKDKPFFVFATYNTMPGNTLWNLYTAAKKTAGQCLGYIQGSITVNIRAWNPKKTSGKSLEKMTETVSQQAKTFGKIITERYQRRQKSGKDKQQKNWKPPKKPLLQLWAAFFTWDWQMRATVGKKHVDKEKCTQCKLCTTKICPTNAIQLSEENYPQFFEKNCVGCNGCVNLCPEDAIWTEQTKKRLPYNYYKDYIINEETINL